MYAVVVEDLWYTYPGGSEPALKGINLNIKEGSFTVIVGPSGCGKTTLCRCLNGLIPHFYGGEVKGRVLIHGIEVFSRPTHELAKEVGMVFQEPEDQLICLTVEREIAFGPENLGLPREEVSARVEWCLRALGIDHLRHRAPYELSGGEQQKVAIAAALALKPKILLLDEPTSNLDPLSAQDLIETLVNLNREGLTIVLVEHRLELVAQHASQMVVLSRGRVVADGDPREVLSSRLMDELGVAVPKPIKLYRYLAKLGIKLRRPPLSPEELVDLLAEVKAANDTH